jgi:hypothetical protein
MRVKPTTFKIEEMTTFSAASSAFTGEAQLMELSKDGINDKLIQHIVEQHGENPDPAERILVGRGVELKAVLKETNTDKLALALNTTASSTLSFSADDVAQLTKYAVRYETYKPDGTREYRLYTNMNVVGDLDQSFKVAEATYLPVTFKSTDETDIEIGTV